MRPADIAYVTHEVNRLYCESIGDTSQQPWYNAPQWQKESAINGVEFHLDNPDATPEQSHENWMAEKQEQGWEYGPMKNESLKLHPCMVPYDELPVQQRVKDELFQAVVNVMRQLIPEPNKEESKGIVQEQAKI